MVDTEKTQNPLLSRLRLPGETHTLPSGGLFYHDGELSSEIKDGEIHVYPMTTLDEITMRSADLLFTGAAIEQIFKRCVPGVLRPKRLLSKDVDFLLTILRKVTYGDDVDLSYTHDCKNAKEQIYNLNIPTLLQQVKRVDPTTVNKKFTIRLSNDQYVQVSPLRYEAVVEMLQLNDKDVSPEARTQQALKFLLNIIDKVDEVTNKEFIKQWLEKVPPSWAHQINRAIDENQNDWGVDFNVNVECKDCKQQIKVAAPLNPLFFFTSL